MTATNLYPYFQMSPEEFQAVTDLLQGKRNQADGLTIGGIHYIVLIADDDCIVCKKGASAGLTIAKAGQCKKHIIQLAMRCT